MHVISLGAGVQSTTLALMAAEGDITPMPACAIFADTGEEPTAVYRHLDWLMAPGRLPFPVHVARAWEGYGKTGIKRRLGDEILAATRGAGAAGSRPPFFVANADGTRGMIRRQCTGDYKVDVIQAKERELLGLERGQRWPGEIRIVQWLGISTDEAARVKPVTSARRVRLCRACRDRGVAKEFHEDRSRPAPCYFCGSISGTDAWTVARAPHPTIQGRWPLIERRASRHDCLLWLARRGYPTPPKSACGFCPFHSDAEWRAIREADPATWARAVEVDRAIRRGLVSKHLEGALYLHASLKPLEEVDLSGGPQRDLFQNECEGMCGV